MTAAVPICAWLAFAAVLYVLELVLKAERPQAKRKLIARAYNQR